MSVPGGVYYTEGYELYKAGEHIPPNRHSLRLTEGWWDAYNAKERFGEYESVMKAPPPEPRIPGRKPAVLPCGSERRYQQHAHTGDTAQGGRRVTCNPCLLAHADHERNRAAQQKLAS